MKMVVRSRSTRAKILFFIFNRLQYHSKWNVFGLIDSCGVHDIKVILSCLESLWNFNTYHIIIYHGKECVFENKIVG